MFKNKKIKTKKRERGREQVAHQSKVLAWVSVSYLYYCFIYSFIFSVLVVVVVWLRACFFFEITYLKSKKQNKTINGDLIKDDIYVLIKRVRSGKQDNINNTINKNYHLYVLILSLSFYYNYFNLLKMCIRR